MSLLDEAFTRYFEKRGRVHPQHTNRSSQAGIECARRLQWNRTRWREQQLPPVDRQRRFEIGNIFEPHVIRILNEEGINVRQSQRDLEWRQFQLTGSIDGDIGAEEDHPVVDVKSTARFTFERIRRYRTAADLLNDEKSYIRGYVVQVALYCLLLPRKRGYVFFVEKDSFRTHTIEVSLDDPIVLEAAEAALQRFERVNGAIAKGVDLDPEPGAVCDDCPFKTLCLTDVDFGDGIVPLNTPEIAAMIARYEELKPLKKEYDEVDKELKETFSKPGIYLVDGQWSVVAKEAKHTSYDLPEDVKAKYKREGKQLRRTYARVVAGATEADPPARASDSYYGSVDFDVVRKGEGGS